MADESEWFDEVARRVEEFAAEQREWYAEGLGESADEFFADRAGWLAQPNSVRAVANSDGTYDVAIRVDGSYDDRETAQSIADLLQAMIYGHLARLFAGCRTDQGRTAPSGGGAGEDDPGQTSGAALDAGAVLR